MNVFKLLYIKIIYKLKIRKPKVCAPPKVYIFDNVEFINSELNDFSYIGKNSTIHNTKIGRFSSIGPNVVCGYGEHPVNFISTSPVFYDNMFYIHPAKKKFFGKTQVNIGNDVWIGANVFIKNGITIGDGAIVGAGAVVLKDIPPYSIAVGVPANIKSKRYDDEIVEKLKTIAWWDWDLEKIKDSVELIGSENIDQFLENFSPSKNSQL